MQQGQAAPGTSHPAATGNGVQASTDTPAEISVDAANPTEAARRGVEEGAVAGERVEEIDADAVRPGALGASTAAGVADRDSATAAPGSSGAAALPGSSGTAAASGSSDAAAASGIANAAAFSSSSSATAARAVEGAALAAAIAGSGSPDAAAASGSPDAAAASGSTGATASAVEGAALGAATAGSGSPDAAAIVAQHRNVGAEFGVECEQLLIGTVEVLGSALAERDRATGSAEPGECPAATAGAGDGTEGAAAGVAAAQGTAVQGAIAAEGEAATGNAAVEGQAATDGAAVEGAAATGGTAVEGAATDGAAVEGAAAVGDVVRPAGDIEIEECAKGSGKDGGKGRLSLEWMRELSDEDATKYLMSVAGLGRKSTA